MKSSSILFTLSFLMFYTVKSQSFKYFYKESKNLKFVGVEVNGKKVIKADKYTQIYANKNHLWGIDKDNFVDIFDDKTYVLKKEKAIRLDPKFYDFMFRSDFWTGSSYPLRYYIASKENPQGQLKYALVDKNFNSITDYIYDEIIPDKHFSKESLYTEGIIVKKGNNYSIINEGGKEQMTPIPYLIEHTKLYRSEKFRNAFAVKDLKRNQFDNIIQFIHPNGNTHHSATAILKNIKTNYGTFNVEGVRTYLLENINELDNDDISFLGSTYAYTLIPQETDHEPTAYKILYEAFKNDKNPITANRLYTFFDYRTQFLQNLPKNGAYKELLEYLSSIDKLYNYDLGVAYYKGIGVDQNTDKAIQYIEKQVENAPTLTAEYRSGYYLLAVMYNSVGNIKEKDRAVKEYFRFGGTVHPITGLSAAKGLAHGEVISYEGRIAAVAYNTDSYVVLTNGDKIPHTNTQFHVLKGESNNKFKKKCMHCLGSGTVTQITKNVYTPSISFSETEYIKGGSISGDKIKTTTVRTRSFNDLKVEKGCSRCAGSGKIIPANELELKY